MTIPADVATWMSPVPLLVALIPLPKPFTGLACVVTVPANSFTATFADSVVKGADAIARIGVDVGEVIDDDIAMDCGQRIRRCDNPVGGGAKIAGDNSSGGTSSTGEGAAGMNRSVGGHNNRAVIRRIDTGRLINGIYAGAA